MCPICVPSRQWRTQKTELTPDKIPTLRQASSCNTTLTAYFSLFWANCKYAHPVPLWKHSIAESDSLWGSSKIFKQQIHRFAYTTMDDYSWHQTLCPLPSQTIKKSFPSVFTKFTTKKPQRDEGAKMTKCQNQWQRSSKNVCDHPHSPNLPKELKNKQTNKHILGLSKLQISYKVIRYSRDLGNKRGWGRGITSSRSARASYFTPTV